MPTIRRPLRRAAVPTAVAVALLLMPLAAFAAGGSHSQSSQAHRMHVARIAELPPLTSHITAHVRWSARNQPDEGSGSCAISVGNPPQNGAGICGTNPQFVVWPNGRAELFIIGLDRAIWHTIQISGQTFSPWSSLGGGANDGVWLLNSGPNAQIQIRGLDDNFWCITTSAPGAGTWSSWGSCNFAGVISVR
jgi:hypothetical protein